MNNYLIIRNGNLDKIYSIQAIFFIAEIKPSQLIFYRESKEQPIIRLSFSVWSLIGANDELFIEEYDEQRHLKGKILVYQDDFEKLFFVDEKYNIDVATDIKPAQLIIYKENIGNPLARLSFYNWSVIGENKEKYLF